MKLCSSMIHCLILGHIKPEINPFHFGSALRSGQRISVTCAVTIGNPPFIFSWMKDGHPIEPTDTLSIRNIDEYNSNLAISKLGPEHNGNYTCKVSNKAGSAMQSNVLLMKGKLLEIKLYLNRLKV